ncbi:competence protein ComEA helix-hairpin-helix repeat protein [Thioalkalivibrio sulfidiphilus HL-EbGr7]|uniref:Competence protein ComEA helix-hairpin-helix repeat protein n=1 Tax=Thioalkalivibrio sulfidiphilus (strain HL-EbGR7) TaxID=396588 RepID=B8GRS8_THISH|nr:ComEA family DNA-binding protein [Thioalkalivibrio sulfidiphilus]ACL72632.1 competence protein ComEA helix-hairpin-helix repeat protein [Thioalkalivibrio sulfidiphilus HL-EbGr7]
MKHLSVIAFAILLFFSLPVFADAPDARINVNTADAQTLTQLTGIGPSRAEAIIAHREQHGPFRSLHELTQVSGIGERTVQENRERIAFE